MIKIVPSYIEALSAYVPGKLIEEVEAELGLSGIVKLASNENSLGPSPKAVEAMSRALSNAHRYGDADSRVLKQALQRKFGYDPAAIVTGNGSSEFILVLCHTLLGPGLKAVMSKPTFTLYAKNAQASGAEVAEAPLTPDFGHDLEAIRRLVDERTRLVFIDNPLNPTGAWIPAEDLLAFHRDLPEQTILVVDEAYVDFSRQQQPDWTDQLHSPGRLVIMRTFSKAYGLAGMRAAYALMDQALAKTVNKVRQPFNMSLLAQVGAVAALDDDDFLQKSLEMTWQSLDFFKAEFNKLDIKTHPTEANFLMIDLNSRSADEVFQKVLHQGVITRSLASFGLPGHLRINAGLEDESQKLIQAMKKVLGATGPAIL